MRDYDYMQRRMWLYLSIPEGISWTRGWEWQQIWLWLKDEIGPGQWGLFSLEHGTSLRGVTRVKVDWAGNWRRWILLLYYNGFSSCYQSHPPSSSDQLGAGRKEESENRAPALFADLNRLFPKQEAECSPTQAIFLLPLSFPFLSSKTIKAVGGCVGLCWLKLGIGPNIPLSSH